MRERKGRLIEDKKLSGNWFVRGKIWSALQTHETEGWFQNQDRIYLGVETNLADIWKQFTSICAAKNASNRLYVRRSCQDESSRKWHIISLYLRQKYNDGSIEKMYQATWTAPIRKSIHTVRQDIETGFGRYLAGRYTFNPSHPLFTEGF